MIALALALGLLVLATAALAQGPGYGRHMGYGAGYSGHMGYGGQTGWGPGHRGGGGWRRGGGFAADPQFFAETQELRNELWQKRAELNRILSAGEIDEDQARSLVADINRLKSRMAEQKLDSELEFRKNNPDAYQYGYGRGPRGGYGPGYCWR
jgi:Spy/CpxP family protein refolding chaperone